MSSSPSNPQKQSRNRLNQLIVKVVNSKSLGWLANLPLISTLLEWTTRRVTQDALDVDKAANIRLAKPTHSKSILKQLEQVAVDVVEELGYVGAMIATYEQGDALAVRAFHIQLNIDKQQIQTWEQKISTFIDPKYLNDPTQPITISNFDSPNVARVFVYKLEFQENLSVRAATSHAVTVSKSLYDLFRPIAPLASKPIVQGIQEELGIQEVIAVPFFLHEHGEQELVGNLFAVKDSTINEKDKSILEMFARHIAVAITGQRRRLQLDIAQRLVLQLQKNIEDETEILRQIVRGVVEDLNYVGAMVATYEQDDSLSIRAFYIDPQIATLDKIREWEKAVTPLVALEFLPDPESPISISDPDSPNIGRVYVEQDKYCENLSIKAAKKGGISFSESLYELFTPMTPPAAKPIITGIQDQLGIKKVIAIPFFLGEDLVGNLFAVSRSRVFSQSEIALLEMFGQQAAAGIRNARLYKRAEQRRKVGDILGHMAFGASANVHALRNHIGFVNTHLQKMERYRSKPERLNKRLDKNEAALAELREATKIIKKLADPLNQELNGSVNVNQALGKALNKINDKLNMANHIQIDTQYGEDLPSIETSFVMLTEVFKILIKNGMEAIITKKDNSSSNILRVQSKINDHNELEIMIQDNGTGIAPQNLTKIFELNWSTKDEGLGFGLFWVRDYIEGLEGRISMTSVLFEGTTFRVILPTNEAVL